MMWEAAIEAFEVLKLLMQGRTFLRRVFHLCPGGHRSGRKEVQPVLGIVLQEEGKRFVV